ncbi:Cof-type HAD-IIB family hydrolase [Miniphocaeibacter halophilus]|uniref:Cof-type HAD-IIB family hydrolase n=1 Tax=Miniphocaeibacter halophilus TaxID=2931922 RepID=A0AC61MVH0_9FIRM|nr:Cof-type HAD-IIB family hydrolase [Miniphocaeibacter halophilus]QQK08029.1 Cof-type HAD-IIB family hydrolase [Miniphocaeibacter halophilus]
MKLFAFDLDGTLLSDSKEITENSLKAIKRINQLGYKWVIVTGRNYDLVKPILEQYDLSCDLILNNGHQYIDSNHKEIKRIPIENETLKEALPILLKDTNHTTIFTNKEKYIFTDKESYFYEHIKILGTVNNNHYLNSTESIDYYKKMLLYNTKTLNLSDSLITKNIDVLKIDLANFDENKIQDSYLLLQDINNLGVHKTSDYSLEITEISSNKAVMLMDLVKEKDFSLENVYIFGDSMNDIELFETFPNSIAMGNANRKIKEKAKWITDTNNNDGIYKAIKNII